MRPTRTYLFVPAVEPLAAAAAVWAEPSLPDLCVTSPSAQAHDTAAYAAAGHFLRTIDEPLLARRGLDESAADVAARYAEALRVLHALTSSRTLVVVDDFPLDGGGPLRLDDDEVLRHAERIERALPVP